MVMVGNKNLMKAYEGNNFSFLIISFWDSDLCIKEKSDKKQSHVHQMIVFSLFDCKQLAFLARLTAYEILISFVLYILM